MKNKKKTIVISSIAILMSFHLAAFAFGDGNTPGSASDPLISKSYVDNLLSGITRRLDTNEKNDAEKIFRVVEVQEGNCLIGTEGCEIVLRTGNAAVVSNGVDGLCDLTLGEDLKNATEVLSNHLLLVPRSDGRGIYCSTKCYVLVKGAYSIE